jgi:hypothetical protein
MGVSSTMAYYRSSASAGGILPIGSSSRQWLNQSTHWKVAYSTASKLRHGPRLWISSTLHRNNYQASQDVARFESGADLGADFIPGSSTQDGSLDNTSMDIDYVKALRAN